MNYHQVGFTQIKVGGAGPKRRAINILNGLLPQLFGKGFHLLFIRPVGSRVRVAATRHHHHNQPYEFLKKFTV